jgi:ELWxxDGT repeat protein
MERFGIKKTTLGTIEFSAISLILILSIVISILSPIPGYALSSPVMVKDINVGEEPSFPDFFAEMGGEIYFIADEGASASSIGLWKSDGTTEGTVLVKDISAQFDGISSPYIVNVNGTIFFSFTEYPAQQLWKSDGTTEGTVLVKNNIQASELFNFNGTLMFNGGGSLWKSDGTTEGTVGVAGVQPDGFVNLNGTLYFAGYESNDGRELWKSDGTTEGTVMVKDIDGTSESSNPDKITAFDGNIFFSTNMGMWKSDGTTEGTTQLLGGIFTDFTDVNGTLFFTGEDDQYDGVDRGLWKTDGTVEGTVFVKNTSAQPGQQGEYIANIGNLTNLGGTLMFVANNGNGVETTGMELWKSDGTTEGTVMVKDINPGSGGSDGAYLKTIGSLMVFQANDGENGFELWQTDGTTEGTELVGDLDPGGESSYPGPFNNVNGNVFFMARDDTHSYELWKATL